MTNFKYWKDRILEIVENGFISVVCGEPVESKCEGEYCNSCDFMDGKGAASCNRALIKWLYSEHEEKPKLTKRERILCEAIKSPENKEISRSHGCLYAGEKKIFQLALEPCMFQFIENGSSWLVSDLLLLEVEE